MNARQRRLCEGILFTDQYQLTMAQLYFRMGMHEKLAQFDHFFRSYPDYGSHMAGYCVNAGLEWLLDWMKQARATDEDVECLRSQRGEAGTRLFADDFLAWFRSNGHFEEISMQAIPEGRVVHPNVPLTVVRGPMAMAQILETALLNQLNFQILIATKASRIRQACRGATMMEFGLRRGHDRGAHAAVRAALIGGADFSSNSAMAFAMGYDPKGTHAHSLVQLYLALGEGELEAFRAYADVYPDDCTLLVDTINTLESGVPNAIQVFEELRRKGHRPVGVRLDSGDLAYLAVHTARMLDTAGFPNVSIVLSNELDEMNILQIITQIQEEAPRSGVDADSVIGRLVYGVGTRLVTSTGDSALGGVYKLVSVEGPEGWVPAIKISESPAKTPNPGDKAVWRLYDQGGKATVDLIGLRGELPDIGHPMVVYSPVEEGVHRQLDAGQVSRAETLLVDVLEHGRMVYDLPSIDGMREARASDIGRLHSGVKRIINPHIYHVSLTGRLHQVKQDLIRSLEARPRP